MANGLLHYNQEDLKKQEIMMNNKVKDGVSISYSAIADFFFLARLSKNMFEPKSTTLWPAGKIKSLSLFKVGNMQTSKSREEANLFNSEKMGTG